MNKNFESWWETKGKMKVLETFPEETEKFKEAVRIGWEAKNIKPISLPIQELINKGYKTITHDEKINILFGYDPKAVGRAEAEKFMAELDKENDQQPVNFWGRKKKINTKIYVYFDINCQIITIKYYKNGVFCKKWFNTDDTYRSCPIDKYSKKIPEEAVKIYQKQEFDSYFVERTTTGSKRILVGETKSTEFFLYSWEEK